MKLRKRGVFVITIGNLALLYTACWLGYSYFKYQPYGVDMKKIPTDSYLFIDKDPYTYSASKPGFGSFTGNLAVSNQTDSSSLIIWPLASGGYEYGLQLQAENGHSYCILVDENMAFIQSDNQILGQAKAEHILAKNEQAVQTLKEKTDLYWNLS
ncbi:hypothetical protein [Listeria costaricensis]|uniref:hypothetical protein n=1 Tax=Listeria costaricensis TaxID=2026604 RepID=UPI000C072C68|nr:hypothetical protein [Listeria costaricensis]